MKGEQRVESGGAESGGAAGRAVSTPEHQAIEEHEERELPVSDAERAQLDQLQAWVAERLVSPRALERDPAAVQRASVELSGSDHLSPVAQLEIYREQFWLRHTSALLEDYPALSAVLGQAAWERLTEGYLAAHPPDSFTLRDLGRALPAYVARCEWLPEQALAEDLARLEWAYVELFDAAPGAPVSHERLAAIPEGAWPTARLGIESSLQLVSARYPVAALRVELIADPARANAPLPAPAEEHLVLYRRGLDMHREPLPALGLALLTQLRAGEPLGAACDALLQSALERGASTSEAAAKELEGSLGAWFQRWAALGFITSVEV
ncbi:MAG: putative DNA-binding domain-containing protein [Polyangiaceae bacterium]|nr:putative DNA-binding domain-containing protein [Polyangiaceae bacterium]MCW5788879.1 putative DNA-binding domain-containing protein [Polyangiaceae bacterium]